MTDFAPEMFDENILLGAAEEAAIAIWQLQNENCNPDGGTLGFTMGCAMALGGMAAVYVEGCSPKKKREFLKIVLGMVEDSFDAAPVTGTIANPQSAH